jgi:hypothetical protein
MTQNFQCGDNAALVGYLYEECDAAERQAIEAHLAVCGACAAEAAALQSTRLQLTSWTPPEADLGFQVVRPQPAGLSPQLEAPVLRTDGWWKQPLPAWAQAAAAVLIFGAGLWLGLMRATDAQPSDAPATQAAAATPSPPASALAVTPAAAASVSAEDLAALERRLRREMAQLRTTAALPADERLLTQVRALIEESEQRQQRELALGMTRVMRDVETQRHVDLAQIQGGFRQIEGVTGAQVREQRDMLNYLMRVSQQGR